jgi:hypothetical protein
MILFITERRLEASLNTKGKLFMPFHMFKISIRKVGYYDEDGKTLLLS